MAGHSLHIGRSPLRPLLTILLMALLTGEMAASDCMAAGNASVSVSAVLLSKSQCKFNTNTAVLNFGNLDPANPVDVTATATLDFVCRGSAPLAVFLFSEDDGLYESAPDGNRMLHAALPGQFLGYSLNLSPATGTVAKNTPQTVTITGTVQGSAYQTALAGTYADTVTITISP